MAMSASGNRIFVKWRGISRVMDSVRFAIREWPGANRLYRYLLWFLVTVALLAYLGPFGTWASLAVSDRVMFWATTVGANWIIGHVVFVGVTRTFRARTWPTWTGLVLAALVSALPGTGMVWLAVTVYLGYQPSGVSGAAGLYTQVFVFHLIIGSLVFVFIDRRLRRRETREEPSSPAENADAVPRPASEAPLLARLPARSRAELLHLRMQDHYVEVHTAAGSELLLLRFRDALREVQGVNGLQVHRSHWVARSAVAEGRAAGGRARGLAARERQPGSRQPFVRSGAQVPGLDLSRDERSAGSGMEPPVPPAPRFPVPVDRSGLGARFDLDAVLRPVRRRRRRGRRQPPAIFGIRCTSLSGPIREKSASW